MLTRTIRTVVVGSGCAGFNAADWLYMLGERDFVLLTENVNAGTSRNTGSDKQTYYKLSLSGDEGDSVGALARELWHEDVNGDTALCEAAHSAECFLRLTSLGVPFPQNAYGEYVGYQTDHDTRRRASSAGPLTSRFMTQALEASVRAKPIEIMNHCLAFRIVTDANGVRGLLCLKTDTKGLLYIACAHVILCTGGPAHIYRDRVYPLSHHGMSGMAFAAGAQGANLHAWQYGLASVKFRWNVSGSYQQVLPRYVSVDDQGVEREFLTDALGVQTALQYGFLKGYQWPYDARKVPGSSQVDILVKQETDAGRRVYMDFRRNPTGYAPENLSEEARTYLENCGATGDTPFERLKAMNAPAIELYRDHGIDIEREMLEVRVCAQHHNGGIAVDANWQSTIPGLYACGEAAGTFGAVRPGGTALNSTQVGSRRAAAHVAQESEREAQAGEFDGKILLPRGDAQALEAKFAGEMSRCAAFIRETEAMRALQGEVEAALADVEEIALDDPQLIRRIRVGDILHTQREVLSAMIRAQEAPEKGVLYTHEGVSEYRPARPLPDRDLWFERVWRESRERTQRRTKQ